MRDNKLIAEWMGMQRTDIGWYDNAESLPPHVYTSNGGNTFDEHELQYHTSWDWLMPVVEKCLTTGDSNHYKLNDALLTCNIKEVYAQVVEFIKAQKK
jgi:hypothetical protein